MGYPHAGATFNQRAYHRWYYAQPHIRAARRRQARAYYRRHRAECHARTNAYNRRTTRWLRLTAAQRQQSKQRLKRCKQRHRERGRVREWLYKNFGGQLRHAPEWRAAALELRRVRQLLYPSYPRKRRAA